MGKDGILLSQLARQRRRKLKRRLRKGVPDQLRGLVWHVISGGQALMQNHPGLYQSKEPFGIDPAAL